MSTDLTATDILEHIKCRTSSFRNDYRIIPGIYAVGNPGKNSDIIVTANYKYSFDLVRKELEGLDIWLLVLDTKGINVWCAAGKGTFGTDELVNRIRSTGLREIVSHKRIIVPQLGAVGVSGCGVTMSTGFRVHFGPVHARDIRSFINAGYKATPAMREILFTFSDRLILTPMEINPAMKKYPLFALIVLLLFGLNPKGIFFSDALTGGLPFLGLGLAAVISGTFLTPLLLPYIPFRSFALKGWLTGMLVVLCCMNLAPPLRGLDFMLSASAYIFFPMFSSYWTLQFTGSTTFTSMSGVKKEMKIALPLYLISLGITSILAAAFKIRQWGLI